MTTRTPLRTRTAVALALTAALSLAACGTRLDHDAVVAAAAGATAGDEYSGGAAGDQGAPDAATGRDAPKVDAPVGKGTVGASDPVGAAAAAAAPGSASGAGPGGPGRGGAGGQGKPIVIGSIGTYSGPAGVAQAPGGKALQIWAAAVNAKGGINGHPVQVIIYDDGGDAAKARSQVKDLVENRHGIAVVAAMSTPLPSWASYVQEKKIPVVGGDCVGDVWHQTPMLFPTCLSFDSIAHAAVILGAKVAGKGTRWGALTCVEADGCNYLDEKWFNKGYAKQAGLVPAYHARISVAQPDFTSECLQARNAGVELFTVVGDPNTVARVAASCGRQGFHPRFLEGSATINEKTASQPGLSNLIAMMPTFPFAGLNTPAAQDFHTSYAKYGEGAVPGGGSSLGWAAAKVFEYAARETGNDISSAGILKGLYTIKNNRFDGLSSPLTYLPGKPAPDSKCWFVLAADKGNWTTPQGDQLDCR